jgi:hypothetical protein
VDAQAATLQVGPGKPFAVPCAAIAAAAAGDTIQIDSAGNYAGDVCQWNTSGLTLIGVGSGRAVLNAAGKSSQGKAIWVISGNNNTVENIEFTGASVVDLNGAGIRAEGSNLTIRNCYFHDNQEGILTDGGPSTILIEFSEFSHNGAGDGFSHNLYIGNVSRFIFRYNYSHGAVIGHLLKSRAAQNEIYYNRLSDEGTGTASYDIDLPNGGRSFIVGNLIEKGPNAQNSALVSYQEEGANSGNPTHELFVVNNTMVNDFGRGTFVVVDGSVAIPAVIKNNVFQGSGSVTTQASAVVANNFSGNAKLVNPVSFDYHLLSGSPAIDAGADPGSGAGVSLAPVFQYTHPACAEGRATTGTAIDIGAYEFNGGNSTPPPSAPSRCGAPPPPPPPAPSVTLAPAALTFSPQTLHTASPAQNVTLTNTGNAALVVSSIAIPVGSDFSQTNTCSSSLAAGSSCTISVVFTPTVAGSRSSSLVVTDNASGSPHSVTLSGSGVSTAPIVSLSPTSLSFPSRRPGTTSPAQQVTLTNTGNAALNISGVTSSGDFAQSNSCGANLSVGASCAFSVTFTPTAGGTRTGTLSVTDDAPASPQNVTLTGTGQAPAPGISLSPTALAFSAALVGSSTAAQPVKVTNTGSGTLSISSVTAGGDFSQTNTCGASLAGGANCSISVTFKPSVGGNRSGTLSISDNATGSPQTVGLSGTGLDFSLSASPNSATVNAGQPSGFNLAISPDGGFNNAVSLACTGAPSGSTCVLTPASVTPSGVTTVAVSVTTTARSFIIPEVPFRAPPPSTVPILSSIIACAALLTCVPRNRKRIVWGFCFMLLAVLAGGGCVGLGSKISPPPPGSGTPAGTYQIKITGTSGSLNHNVSFTLKVN